jgi:hypothetical protein
VESARARVAVLVGRCCKAVHARPLAAVLAGRGHGVTAARKDGDGAHTPWLECAAWLIIHVELKVSAPFECGAMHCASSVVHREGAHTLGSNYSFCGGWLVPGPQATALDAAAAGPYQPVSRELRGLPGDHPKFCSHVILPGDQIKIKHLNTACCTANNNNNNNFSIRCYCINNKASSAYRHVSEPFGAACPEFAFAYEFALQLSTMSLLLHGFVP